MIGRIDPSQTRLGEPWLGEMPQLVSQQAYEEGSETWRARTSGGAEVLARRLSTPSTLAAPAYLDRLKRLHQDQPPNLAPLAGGLERPDGVWILSRPIAAIPLQRLLDPGLDLAPALAVGMGVLQGLAALRRAGLGQQVDSDSVLIDTVGATRLDGTWVPLDEVAGQVQVQATGRLLCLLLGIPEKPSDTLTAAERQAPALAAATRSMAGGAIGDVSSALALLHEAAGGLAAPAQLKRSAKLMAESVRRLLSGQAPAAGRRSAAGTSSTPAPPPPAYSPVPSAAPDPPPRPPAPEGSTVPPPMPNPVAPARAPKLPATRPVAIGPRPSRESTWRAKPPPSRTRSGVHPAMVLAAAVLAMLVVVALFVAFRAIRSGGPQVATTPPVGQATAPPVQQPTPPPGPPASAGDVQQVTLAFDQAQPCSSGDRACALGVDVHLTQVLEAPEDVTWGFRVTDLCTGQTQTIEAPSAAVHAQAGWNHVQGSSVIALPASKRLQIVAATSAPAVAGSVPLLIGAPSC
jgi:hypothetical protein